MRGLEQAGLVGMRAGETALLVAEEFAFHQFGGDGAAVDRHKWTGRACALLVDGAGDQLLAHARFADDVDRRLAARDLADGGAQAFHRAGVAEQAAGLFRRRRGRGGAVAVVQFQRVLDQAAQHADVHRLADEVEGAGLQGFHRQVHAAERGDHRHRGLRIVLGDFGDQLDAVAVGQPHVGQAQVVGIVGQQLARFGQVGGGADAQAHPAQGENKQFANVTLVIDNQGTFRFVHVAHDSPRR